MKFVKYCWCYNNKWNYPLFLVRMAGLRAWSWEVVSTSFPIEGTGISHSQVFTLRISHVWEQVQAKKNHLTQGFKFCHSHPEWTSIFKASSCPISFSCTFLWNMWWVLEACIYGQSLLHLHGSSRSHSHLFEYQVSIVMLLFFRSNTADIFLIFSTFFEN